MNKNMKDKVSENLYTLAKNVKKNNPRISDECRKESFNKILQISNSNQTSKTELMFIYNLKHTDFNLALASNTNISEELFLMLSRENNQLIRLTLAMNPSIPKDIYNFLAKDKKKRVRVGIILNPITTEKTLQFFLKDKDSYVRKIAKEEIKKRRN